MRLLLVTQALDLDDPVLSAYHGWVAELATHFEQIEVVCLKEGRHALPANVAVHSLGKEHGRQSRTAYALRFLSLVWRLRDGYDAAFVHMNQEYILIAGCLWKLLGKPVYLWRNHYAGSFLTDIAAAFCAKIFCTSAHSYTAKYPKTELMPVGVDTDRFNPDECVRREPRSILFFSRIAPSKRADLFIEALGLLLARGVSFVASVYGSPQSSDAAYYESLEARAEQLGLHDRVRFHPGIPNEKAPDIYRAHEIYVNCSPNGMFDKILFEASASGCVVLAISEDFAAAEGTLPPFTDAESLATSLERELARGEDDRAETVRGLLALARRNSLAELGTKLAGSIQGPVSGQPDARVAL